MKILIREYAHGSPFSQQLVDQNNLPCTFGRRSGDFHPTYLIGDKFPDPVRRSVSRCQATIYRDGLRLILVNGSRTTGISTTGVWMDDRVVKQVVLEEGLIVDLFRAGDRKVALLCQSDYEQDTFSGDESMLRVSSSVDSLAIEIALVHSAQKMIAARLDAVLLLLQVGGGGVVATFAIGAIVAIIRSNSQDDILTILKNVSGLAAPTALGVLALIRKIKSSREI